MPQMMPLNWLSLFIFFVIIFMMFNSMIFFNKIHSQNKTKTITHKKNINWKW